MLFRSSPFAKKVREAHPANKAPAAAAPHPRPPALVPPPILPPSPISPLVRDAHCAVAHPFASGRHRPCHSSARPEMQTPSPPPRPRTPALVPPPSSPPSPNCPLVGDAHCIGKTSGKASPLPFLRATGDADAAVVRPHGQE